jgi:hypothetical protein
MSHPVSITPNGRALTVVTCSKKILLRGLRVESRHWSERLPTVAGWVVAVYAESEIALWLYSALSGMLGAPDTGGLLRNIARTDDSSVLYAAQWSSGLRVGLADQDPALEGGLSALMRNEQLWRQGTIPMPAAVAAIQEIAATCPDVDAILLPASPKESNSMRVALARVLLVRPGAMARLNDPRPLALPRRLVLLPAIALHRAPDRTASLEDPPGKTLWVAPRIAYFLIRRRIAQAKDWLRRVFIEKPRSSIVSVGEFLSDRPDGSAIELLRAFADLAHSLLEGWALLLIAVAMLIGALSKVGLL